MANNVQGNHGIRAVHEVLARLAADTTLLGRTLQQLGSEVNELPPPPYSPPSNNSGTVAQPQRRAPPPPRPTLRPEEAAREERDRLFKRRYRLQHIHDQSLPHKQFESQSWCLAKRLAVLRFGEKNPDQPFPSHDVHEQAYLIRQQLPKAQGIIRARWQEQGIWHSAWKNFPPVEARWPHEDYKHELAMFWAEPRRPRQRRTRATEAAAAAAASRPYNQFVYQVAKERDLLLGLVGDLDRPPLPPRKPWVMRTRYSHDPPWRSPSVERADDEAYERRRLQSHKPPVPAPLKKAPKDVHSTAYEAVKAEWVRCEIWDPSWTVLPGLRWMHEEPLERFINRRMAEEDGVEWNEEEEEEEEDEDEEDEQEDTEATASQPQLAATSGPPAHVPAATPRVMDSPPYHSLFGPWPPPPHPPPRHDVAAAETDPEHVPAARASAIEAPRHFSLFGPSPRPPHPPPQPDAAAAETDPEPQAGPLRAGAVPGDDGAGQERPLSPASSFAAALMRCQSSLPVAPAERDAPLPPGTSPPQTSKRRRDSEASETGSPGPAKRTRTAADEGSDDAPGDNGAHDANGAESSRLDGTGGGGASQPP